METFILNTEDVIKKYIAGDGKISFGMGFAGKDKTPFISIGELSESKEIGENLLGKDEKDFNITTIYFKNLESLAVLENCIQKVKDSFNGKNI